MESRYLETDDKQFVVQLKLYRQLSCDGWLFGYITQNDIYRGDNDFSIDFTQELKTLQDDIQQLREYVGIQNIKLPGDEEYTHIKQIIEDQIDFNMGVANSPDSIKLSIETNIISLFNFPIFVLQTNGNYQYALVGHILPQIHGLTIPPIDINGYQLLDYNLGQNINGYSNPSDIDDYIRFQTNNLDILNNIQDRFVNEILFVNNIDRYKFFLDFDHQVDFNEFLKAQRILQTLDGNMFSDYIIVYRITDGLDYRIKYPQYEFCSITNEISFHVIYPNVQMTLNQQQQLVHFLQTVCDVDVQLYQYGHMMRPPYQTKPLNIGETQFKPQHVLLDCKFNDDLNINQPRDFNVYGRNDPNLIKMEVLIGQEDRKQVFQKAIPINLETFKALQQEKIVKYVDLLVQPITNDSPEQVANMMQILQEILSTKENMFQFFLNVNVFRDLDSAQQFIHQNFVKRALINLKGMRDVEIFPYLKTYTENELKSLYYGYPNELFREYMTEALIFSQRSGNMTKQSIRSFNLTMLDYISEYKQEEIRLFQELVQSIMDTF